MMIEKDEPQTESNELTEQQTNQNEQGHHDKQPATSFPAHLFAIRGRRKRGPGTLQTRD